MRVEWRGMQQSLNSTRGPEGWPQKFLLQLLSDLTSILTVFLLFLNYSNTTVKIDNVCYVLRNLFFPPVYAILLALNVVYNRAT